MKSKYYGNGERFLVHRQATHFVKVSALPNLLYKLNTVTIKIQQVYFVAINTLILKFIQRGKKIQNSQPNMEIEQNWRIDFRTYHKAMVIKTVRY